MERAVCLPPNLRPSIALLWLLVSLFLFGLSGVFMLAFIPFGPVVTGLFGLVATDRLRRYRAAVIEARTPVEPSVRLIAQIRPEPRRRRWRPRRTLVTLRGRFVPSLETVLEETLRDRVAHDDIGVAFIRRGQLVDFVRFDV